MQKQLIDQLLHHLTSEQDKNFTRRVWCADHETYESRIKAIGFNNLDHVLDAGCGVGQWLYALSKCNKKVTGIEFDEPRVNFCKGMTNAFQLKNTSIVNGSVESLPFDDNSFDAIFSYSVILCTDYRKTLQEYYRVLKPQGKLYFNTNGLGWYLHNLLQSHNDTVDFSSREMAKVALETTIEYYANNTFNRKKYAAIISPKNILLEDLKKTGFNNISVGPEGTINFNGTPIKSFFKGMYEEYEGVTEYFCRK